MLKQLFGSNKRPYFRDLGPWEKRTFDLSGCKLEISMPPHDFEFPEEGQGNSINIFNTDIYKYNSTSKKSGLAPHYKGVTYPGVILRKWDSFGPFWDSSPIGMLKCNLTVCDISQMKTSLNCFNPEHLERLILHGLYYSDGPGAETDNEFKTPVNWNIKSLHDSDWVSYESWPQKPAWENIDRPHIKSNFTRWLCAPIFHDKYLLFAFSAIGSLPAEPSNKLMQKRIQNIISSIKLTLSSEAAQQKAAALKQFPKVQYSQHRDPEPWQYYGSFREGDPFKGEDDVVLEGECTPPPSLD